MAPVTIDKPTESAKQPVKRTRSKGKVRIVPRHKKAFDMLTETNGVIAPALRAVGYSPSVVDHPSFVTETKSWQALVAENLKDEKVLKRHDEGLDAEAHGEPDYNARYRYVELAYKLKGKLVPDLTQNVNVALFLPSELISKQGLPVDNKQ